MRDLVQEHRHNLSVVREVAKTAKCVLVDSHMETLLYGRPYQVIGKIKGRLVKIGRRSKTKVGAWASAARQVKGWTTKTVQTMLRSWNIAPK